MFQNKVDETFGDLTGVAGIADDIVVAGFNKDGSDHDSNLHSLMERARSTGIKFNPNKCVIKSTSIPFYGHILSAEGLQADPAKVEAVNAMDPSTSVQDLQSFLGATQYLSRFIPHLASLRNVAKDTKVQCSSRVCPRKVNSPCGCTVAYKPLPR